MKFSENKTPIVIMLIAAFIHLQVGEIFANDGKKNNKVRVAFLGVQFQNEAGLDEKRFEERLEGLFSNSAGLEVMKNADVKKLVGENRLAQVFEDKGETALKELADELKVAYLYFGKVDNQKSAKDRLLFVGELVRFDSENPFIHKFDLLKYSDQVGVELLRFENEYVKTVAPVVEAKKTLWPWLIIVGVAALSLITLGFVSASGGSEGGDDGNGGSGPVEAL